MYKDIMYDALSKARGMFKLYAELHRAKGTVDSDAKAKVNEDMVAIMNEALSAQPAPLAAGEDTDKVRGALAGLEDAINAEGFGCACMPDVKCATCKARDLMSKWVRPSFEKLREALSAQPAPSVPEGWQLVPKIPTQAMLEASDRHCHGGRLYPQDFTHGPRAMRRTEYAAMLAAAPSPTAPPSTPNASLPLLGEGPRTKIQITVEVPPNRPNRLDMQWVLEREIHADRWAWNWPTTAPKEQKS